MKPKPIKRVLIPIDYHPVSEKIAEVGADLAHKLGAKVCLLHILTDFHFYNTEFPSFFGYKGYGRVRNIEMEEELQEVAHAFLKKAAAHINQDVDIQIMRGDTPTAIMDYATEWGADLIVMGTHSRSVLEKIFIGSVANKVLENTKIPVYMVPVKK